MSQKISVIIPVYNVEKYLDKCVQSVINQTYTELEIILVDDGSTDKSGVLCDEYAKRDERIKVIHKSNGGLSQARNYALDVITGDYVFFLDSDYFLALTALEKMERITEEEQADIVACLDKRFTDEDVFGEKKGETLYFTREEMLQGTFTQNKNYFIISCAKLYEASLFNGVRFIEGVIHEDEFICHKIYAQTKKVAVLQEELYFYRENPNSITGVKYNPKRYQYLLALKERADFFRENNFPFYQNFALYFAYRCIDLYFEVPPSFKERKQVKKEIKKTYKYAYTLVKGIKSPSKKRFILFKISPWLYGRILKK